MVESHAVGPDCCAIRAEPFEIPGAGKSVSERMAVELLSQRRLAPQNWANWNWAPPSDGLAPTSAGHHPGWHPPTEVQRGEVQPAGNTEFRCGPVNIHKSCLAPRRQRADHRRPAPGSERQIPTGEGVSHQGCPTTKDVGRQRCVRPVSRSRIPVLQRPQ